MTTRPSKTASAVLGALAVASLTACGNTAEHSADTPEDAAIGFIAAAHDGNYDQALAWMTEGGQERVSSEFSEGPDGLRSALHAYNYTDHGVGEHGTDDVLDASEWTAEAHGDPDEQVVDVDLGVYHVDLYVQQDEDGDWQVSELLYQAGA